MDAITLYRIAHWLYLHKVPFIPKIFQIAIFLLFNSYIPYQTIIGKGTKIGHRGVSVVINKDAAIGENVLIRAHVTIGKKNPTSNAPIVEDNVEIGDGAKILGNIRVGKGAIIGANAVVIRDVPAYSLAIGVPAKVLSIKQNV